MMNFAHALQAIPRAFILTTACCAAVLVGGWRTFRCGTRDALKRGVVIHHGVLRPRHDFPRAAKGVRALTFAGVPLPFLDETKHFKMIGTTGTGKSTAIRELVGAALARGDRAVFADPDGGYRDQFFNRYRGDIVLNPFDDDSVRWDPFQEISQPFDIEELSAGLIPSSEDASSNEWRAYARTFVTAMIGHCHAQKRSCTELWRLLSVATVDELRSIAAGTPAQSFLDTENSRMFGSIRSVAMSSVAALKHVQAQRASSFSIRHWVQREGAQGALFIPYRAGQIAALRSLIATWMRIAIFEAMSGKDDRDRRLWFVIDELDALGPVEGLKDALARLRKFGGRCVLGFQSIAQVSGTYGAAGAQTIVENCGNTLILRCSGSENGGTSQFASRLIGDREVIRRQTTRGSDREAAFLARGARRSRNTSEQHVTEAAVLASQIEQLPDLCGYFKTASGPSWRTVSLGGHRSCPPSLFRGS